MARGDVAFIQLFWEIINRKTGSLGQVTYKPQKPAFPCDEEALQKGIFVSKEPVEQAFPRSTPEEQGLSSEYIAAFVQALMDEKDVHMHQLMILRHGHVIYESGFSPYPAKVWHVSYSMCKSMTGMAIGLLIDDGILRLEDRLIDILEINKVSMAFLRYRDVTIRHLLTMTTGSTFNEIGAITGDNWIKGYLEGNVKFEPGSQFDYNSMNSFMLSAIVTKLTGRTLFDFLDDRLFAPLGIKQIFWEASPKGITKGGWGMFITQEDAAKLGQLYLQKGVWNGRRILSEKWVEEATKAQIITGKPDNPLYGFHLWMEERPGSYIFNGMLGQNVYVYPDMDMLIVTNAGNPEMFSTGGMTEVIRKYTEAGLLKPTEGALPKDKLGEKNLRRVKDDAEGRDVRTGIEKLTEDGPLKRRKKARQDAFLRKLDGAGYDLSKANVGLMPLMMQVVHNNYTDGIRRIAFSFDENRILHLHIREGETEHDLKIGFGTPLVSRIDEAGEPYLVSVLGKLGQNEDDQTVLTLRIAFIEEANERGIKIVFTDKDTVELRFSESPGEKLILNSLELITTGSGNVNLLVDKVMSQISMDLIHSVMQGTIAPTVTAIKCTGDKDPAALQESRSVDTKAGFEDKDDPRTVAESGETAEAGQGMEPSNTGN